MLACPVDRCNRLPHRHTLGLRDRLQAAPERIFERDAGLVAIDHDGAFDDLRFHGAPSELKAVLGIVPWFGAGHPLFARGVSRLRLSFAFSLLQMM